MHGGAAGDGAVPGHDGLGVERQDAGRRPRSSATPARPRSPGAASLKTMSPRRRRRAGPAGGRSCRRACGPARPRSAAPRGRRHPARARRRTSGSARACSIPSSSKLAKWRRKNSAIPVRSTDRCTAASIAGGTSRISSAVRADATMRAPADELVAERVVAVGVGVDERVDLARRRRTPRASRRASRPCRRRSNSVSTSSVSPSSTTNPAFESPQPPSGWRYA